MLPITRTLSNVAGGTASDPVVLDYFISPFNVSLSVLVTGSVNYTVQYTFDKVLEPTWTSATGNWVNHPNLTSQTATLDSNLAYPATAVRIVVNSGTGAVRFTVIQAGVA